VDAVTGAFSYTGRWIADRLLSLGREVITLSHSAAPPQLSDPEALPRNFRPYAPI
jgi:hypothetical protein